MRSWTGRGSGGSLCSVALYVKRPLIWGRALGSCAAQVQVRYTREPNYPPPFPRHSFNRFFPPGKKRLKACQAIISYFFVHARGLQWKRQADQQVS